MRNIKFCKQCEQFRNQYYVDSYGCGLDEIEYEMMSLKDFESEKIPINCKYRLEQIVIGKRHEKNIESM